MIFEAIAKLWNKNKKRGIPVCWECLLLQSLNDRLERVLEKNLALRVKPYEDSTDKWVVFGRGVLLLSVLIETMRSEGYELQVGQPQVIYKEIDGKKCEPIEELTINVPEEFASKMIAMVTRHKGEIERRVNGSMISMDTGNAFAYAIDKLQYRGKFFIDPGEDFKQCDHYRRRGV